MNVKIFKIHHVGVYGHFSTSDHNILYWTTNVVARPTVNTGVVRNYNKADVDSIKKDLRDANWELDSGKKCQSVMECI